MGYLRVTNWHKYQHYRNRKPVWIKLYVDVLYDDKLRQLPVATRLLWDQLMLLAAERANVIPNDPELVAKLVGIPPRDCREGLEQLLKGRWLSQTSGTRRASKPASKPASPEKEREIETPKPPLGKPTKYPCAECGLLFASTARVADHRFNVHGIEGLRAVEAAP